MSDLVGQTIGNYRIEARLGAGGMGQVFQARHIHLDRPGALKLMHETLAFDPGFRERFLREARAIATLRHPHIVEVFEYDEHQSRAYMVMELITGGSMRSLLQRYAAGKERPLAPLLDLVRQAADGLAFAHSRGVIHRDIKPDNLLLATGDRNAIIVKVGDFGLARMAEGAGMTATGAVMGTPAYMSPEQCQGLPLDARTDIYSLGVVLYEATVGVLPFQAQTISEAAYKHVHTPPPPPSSRVSGFPANLERVILRCLAKQPDERYASMEELSTELRHMITGLPAGQTVMTAVAGAPVAPVAATQKPTAGAVPESGPAPLPPPTPAPGVTARVQVLDQQRKLVREVDLSQAGLTIGRQSRNAIVLDAEAVSRSHAQIGWNGQQATITDLGSSNGTKLGDRALSAQAAVPWNPAELVVIGPFALRLVPPVVATPAGPSVMADPMLADLLSGAPSGAAARTPIDKQTTVRNAQSQRIVVLPDPATITMLPGIVSTFRVTLINQGTLVDHFPLELLGVPSGCQVDIGTPVELLPGRQEVVTVTIRSQRSAEVRAGSYAVTLRARSRQNPAELHDVPMTWIVQPFREAAISLSPRRARGRGAANYQVQLENRGNAPIALTMAGDDDERSLNYQFTPPVITIEPGATAPVRLRTSGSMPLVGSPQTRMFRVSANDTSPQPALTANAEWVQLPLLPAWAPPALLALLVGLCLALSRVPAVQQIIGTAPTATLQPTTVPTPTPEPGAPDIGLFEVQPQQIAPGGSVTVRWEIANPETVESIEIDQFGTVEMAGSKTHQPRTDTKYTLVVIGKNGKRYTRVEDVLVVDSAATAQAKITPTITPTPTTEPTSEPTATPTWTPVPPTEMPGDPGVVPPFTTEILGNVLATDRQIVFHNDFPNLNVGAFDGDFKDQTRQNIGRWDSIVAMGQRKLFLYRASDGQGAVIQIRDDGTALVLQQMTGFSRDWSQIVYAGNDTLLFYNGDNGAIVLAQWRGDRYQMLRGRFEAGRGWTHVVGAVDGTVLFYNARSGDGLVGYVDNGTYTEMQQISGFSTGWTHLVSTGGRLVFYNSENGLFVLASLARGHYDQVTELQSPGAGWTHLAALSDGTLLFVQSETGRRQFLVPAAVGYLDAGGGDFSRNWRIIVGLLP